MTHSNPISRTTCIAIAAVALISSALVSIPSSLAQSQRKVNRLPAKAIVFQPPREGAPKVTTGAATRNGGACASNASLDRALSVLPILPPQTQYGLTFASRPTFLAYVPPATSAKQMFFSLKSADGDQIYQTFLPLTSDQGLVAVSLPSAAPELAVDRNYKWSMAIVCGQALRPDSPRIEGWVKRVARSSEISTKLQTLTPLDRVALYGQYGIWYDMMGDLNLLRRTSPNDQIVSSAWQQLLKDNGLQEVVSISIPK
jgi:hypothetical protein